MPLAVRSTENLIGIYFIEAFVPILLNIILLQQTSGLSEHSSVYLSFKNSINSGVHKKPKAVENLKKSQGIWRKNSLFWTNGL